MAPIHRLLLSVPVSVIENEDVNCSESQRDGGAKNTLKI